MGALAIVAYQALVSQSIDPQEPSVLTVGSFQAGNANNVIPDSAVTSVNFTAGTGMASRAFSSLGSGPPLCVVRLNTLEATNVETATAARKAQKPASILRVIELVRLRVNGIQIPPRPTARVRRAPRFFLAAPAVRPET